MFSLSQISKPICSSRVAKRAGARRSPAFVATSSGVLPSADAATCWVGSFFPHKVRQILGIPEDIQVIELMAIGYPADEKPERKRGTLEDIVSYDKWNFA